MSKKTLKYAAAIVATLATLATPAFAQAPIEAVKRQRAAYTAPISKTDMGNLLRAIAADLNATTPGGPYGVLKKTSGNNCGGISCDIICLADLVQYDVFRDEDGVAEPQWNRVANPAPQGGCQFVSTPPPPPPPSCTDCLEDVKVLRGQVRFFEEALAWHQQELAFLTSELARVLADVQALQVERARLLSRQPTCKVRGFFRIFAKCDASFVEPN